MPGEWEEHEATWLAWPHNHNDWPGKLDAIRWAYCEIVRKICAGEVVRMLVRGREEEKNARCYLTSAGVDPSRLQFIIHPTNRSWMRDSGPVFVRRRSGKRSETAIVDFHFNAWAKYDDWQKDRKVPGVAGRTLGRRVFSAEHLGTPFVLEGGGIDVNGRGTLLTTAECYLDKAVQVRNPGLGRRQFEAVLEAYLGATNVLWLGKGPAGDDTHGHVDDIARFVDPTTIVLVREDDRKDENYRALAENWEKIRDFRLEDGTRPDVVPLPMPGPIFFDGQRLPASYANFYISNAAVIVPTFNDARDRIALGTLADLFTDREVVGVHAVDLVLGQGTLHCLSQQQPR